MNAKAKLIACCLMAASVISCEQNGPEFKPGEVLTNILSVTTTSEPTKAYYETGAVKWKNSDTLIVFDDRNKGVKLKPTSISSDKLSATFETEVWTTNIPKYAACYCSEWDEAKVLTAPSEGIIPVRVRKTQNNLQWKGTSSPFSSPMVGKVEKISDKYTVEEMKNVVGFIGIELGLANVATIKATSLGEEPLCGFVEVDYSKLAAGDDKFWAFADSAEDCKTVVVTPSSGGNSCSEGCFLPGKYYFSVLPQTYSGGIAITYLDAGGNEIGTKTIGAKDSITVSRNSVALFDGAVDDNLPDTVIINLNFSSGVNPLGFGTPGAANENATTGETYFYKYVIPGTADTLDVPVTVCKGTSANAQYLYHQKTDLVYGTGYILNFNAHASWISVPSIPGRYLSNIKVTSANAYSRWLKIRESALVTTSVTQRKTKVATSDGPGTTSISFFSNGNDGETTSLQSNTTEAGKSYVVQIFSTSDPVNPTHGLMISDVQYTYTRTLSEK